MLAFSTYSIAQEVGYRGRFAYVPLLLTTFTSPPMFPQRADSLSTPALPFVPLAFAP